MSLKEKAASLPFDPTSVHYKIRQNAMMQFDETITAAGRYTVIGMIECLQSTEFCEGKSALPEQLSKLGHFVKGDDFDSRFCGRVNPNLDSSRLLKFLPFTERSFLIYMADVVMALRLAPLLQGQIDDQQIEFPVSSIASFLLHVETIMDYNRCSVREIVEATEGIRQLSSIDVRTGLD